MLLLWDRLIPQVKVSLGKYLRTKTVRLSYLKLHIMQPEWHGPAHAARPIQEFPAHLGKQKFSARAGLADYCSWAAAGWAGPPDLDFRATLFAIIKTTLQLLKYRGQNIPNAGASYLYDKITKRENRWTRRYNTQPFGPTQARRNPEGRSGCGRDKSYFLGNTIKEKNSRTKSQQKTFKNFIGYHFLPGDAGSSRLRSCDRSGNPVLSNLVSNNSTAPYNRGKPGLRLLGNSVLQKKVREEILDKSDSDAVLVTKSNTSSFAKDN